MVYALYRIISPLREVSLYFFNIVTLEENSFKIHLIFSMRIKKMSIVALAYHEILYRDIKANDILPNKKVELCYEYL